MINKKFYLTLSRSYLADENKTLFCKIFKNDFEELFEILNKKFVHLLPEKQNIDDEISLLRKEKIEILTINDEYYPKMLNNISIAPVVLTLKGNKEILNQQNVAVVGSRKLEKNDYKLIKNLVKFLNDLNFNVVSGLAQGSDIISHIQSINQGTIAVMPCGLKYCYPVEHKIIAEKIVDMDGAIISEFNFNEPPKQCNFIQRNSTIVGISNSVIITRAREIRSGTMSNVKFANQFGRNIYTFNLNDFCNGNRYLLQNKIAQIIDNFEDLKLNLIIDIAKNQHLLTKNNNINDNVKNNICNNNLFGLNNSVQSEIYSISKFAKLQLNEKNIYKIYKLCIDELKIDKKTLLTEILKLVN